MYGLGSKGPQRLGVPFRARAGIREISVLFVLMLAACGTLPRDVLPESLSATASVAGYEDVRFWGDQSSAALDRSLAARVEQTAASHRLDILKTGKAVDISYLVLSGGGADGAYGAGLLAGWSETGRRPEFEVVTGVSTGALIAPFAFLGLDYDRQLTEIYTTIDTSDVATPQIVAGIFGGDAVADSSPLAAQIARFVDGRLLAAVAHEHDRGRRLFVATTNIDAQRPVIWDMGAIAKRGTGESLELFRKVLLASASIPGVFPPVRVEVTAGGQAYQELHVDGGTVNQLFLLPIDVNLDSYAARKVDPRKLRRHLYIIRNTKVAPEYMAVEDRTFQLVGRSVSTLIKAQGVGDLYKVYLTARAQRMDFNYAAIPPEFTLASKEPFDKAYMQALYRMGYESGQAGYPWQKLPPGMTEVARVE
jgi:predicted acylesterase/phospholipase RssA